jgi:D-methionine transport system ATP-binding protein
LDVCNVAGGGFIDGDRRYLDYLDGFYPCTGLKILMSQMGSPTQSNPDWELSFDHVSVKSAMGRSTLLNDISFTVDRPGSKIGIVGASGAGKTTLLRVLNRLVSPNAGKVFWRGKSLEHYPVPTLRRQILLVPQEPRLLGMTVEQALAYPLQIQNLSSAETQQQVQRWCQQMGLPEEWRSRQELELSVGQRQWVSLVRGLVAQPQVLLLDEPTSALDSGRIDHLISTLKALDCTVLMVSHQRAVVEKLCDRILWMDQGTLQLDCSMETVDWQAIEAVTADPKPQDTSEWNDA